MTTSAMSPPMMLDPTLDVDKISYEIFSILESKFLFGYDDPNLFSTKTSPELMLPSNYSGAGKVRILSIDGGSHAADVLLAAGALVRLEASLRRLSGDPNCTVADFFDVAAGSGAGGVLAAMLFTKTGDRQPYSAAEAAEFIARHGVGAFSGKRRSWWPATWKTSGGSLRRRVFGGATLRDAAKAVLVPCYDMATAAPFMFSRADAMELDGCDFKMEDVCAATCAERTVQIKSVDGRRRVVAVGGGVAMGNPTAVAITHVLNNKHEFPLAAGVDDLLVVSIGSAVGDLGIVSPQPGTPSRKELARIASAGAADMVDQAVSMAFGASRASNYVRIQANGLGAGNCTPKPTKDARKLRGVADDILAQRNVSSVMFRGKKITDETNGEKLERFANELVKENERRKKSPVANVMLKQVITPRTSSATTSTVITATTVSSGSSTSPSH